MKICTAGALSATALFLQLIRRISNGLLDPPAAAGDGIVIVLILLSLAVFLFRLGIRQEVSSGWMLIFVSGTLLLLFLVVNEVIRAVPDNRIRYLMPLWPLGSLPGRHRSLAALCNKSQCCNRAADDLAGCGSLSHFGHRVSL